MQHPEVSIATSDGADTARPQCPMVNGIPYQPISEDQIRDPHPWLEAARVSQPVFFLEEIGAWVVTRYEDVLSVVRNTKIFSSRRANQFIETLPEQLSEVYPNGHPGLYGLVNSDPPVHTRMRKLANIAFLPAAVAQMEPVLRRRADELIDSFYADGTCDFMKQYSEIFALRAITDLGDIPIAPEPGGLPLESWEEWARDASRLQQGAPPITPEMDGQIAERARTVLAWLATFFPARRAKPGEDIISRAILAATDDGEPSFSDAELVGLLNGLLTAGHTTSAAFMSFMLQSLLNDPPAWDSLREDPSRIDEAIEEALRFWTPLRGMRRIALEDVTIGGQAIAAGEQVFVSYHSANRDDAVFPEDPNEFDIDRADLSRHLAFGKGTHFCIGAPLARLEALVTFEALIARLPALRLVPDDEQPWELHMRIPRPNRLLIAWDVDVAASSAAEPALRA